MNNRNKNEQTQYFGKTVAFCTSNLTSKLSREIWAGIQRAAKSFGVNTICYTGELLFPDEYETNQRCANIVYDFIDPRSVDAVIIYAGDIGELVETERIQKLCDTFKDLPIVSIAREIPGIPTVTIDNYSGMYALVDHMIEYHGYRKIAFVQGPAEHPEAQERFTAYCDVLKKHDIPFADELVCEGDFSRMSGHHAVENLFDEKKLNIDAVIGVDDETAVGVYEACRSRGILVPEHVAIGGFDNDSVSGVLESPLTTVEQPLHQEGEQALEIITQLWNGETPENIYTISTEVVIRRSCGCHEQVFRGSVKYEEAPAEFGDYESMEESRDILLNILLVVNREQELGISRENAEKLIDDLIEAHRAGTDRTFTSTLWDILTEISDRGGFISPMQEVFSLFHKIGIAELNRDSIARFENILHRGRIIIGSIAERVNSFQRINAVEKLIDLGDVNYALNALFSRKSAGTLFSRISDSDFDRLGIKTFYLVLYSFPKAPLKESRLHFAWEEGVSKEVYEDGISFETLELLPEKYKSKLREKHFAISPLYFGSEQYGYLLIETAPWDSMVCDVLSWQVGSAFKRVDLIRREEERRKELQLSLDELKRTQHMLVEAEKMAALGNLVAGVAHEINTPLGAGVTYASYLEEITERLNESFSEGKLTKSALEDFLEKGREVSRGLMLNLNRAAELIRSFKEVAVDQTSSERRIFNVKEYIEEILLSLKNTIKRSGHNVELNCPDSLTIENCPGALSQILTNLVMNSLNHAFTEGMHGEIAIQVTDDENSITMIYRDNGKGLSEEVRNHIFEPFFTTKRNEGGSGLGMHIVYNLATQSLGGTITCESAEGKGVLFTITFPKE